MSHTESRFVPTRKLLCPWRMAAIAILLNLIAYGLVYYVLQQSRQLYQDRAMVVSQNMAHLLEHGIAESINKVELAALVAIDEIAERESTGAIKDTSSINRWLTRLDGRLMEKSTIRTYDAAGEIRFGAEGHVGSVNIAERNSFIYLRDHPDAGTVVSEPVVGAISKQWVIHVSRRMIHADGSFAGIVSGAIPLEHFAKLFSTVDAGQNGFVALHDRELGRIIQYSKHGGVKYPGEKTDVSQLNSMLTKNPEVGSFIALSPETQVHTMNSFRKVKDRPLYVIVGLADKDYLADWHNEVTNTLWAIAIFSFITILASGITCWYWQRRMESLHALEQNEKMFRELTKMCTDWFWEQDSNFRFSELSGELVNIFGTSQENFIGKTRWDIAVDMPEEKMAIHKMMVMAHLPFNSFEYSFYNEEGEKRTISASGMPLFDAEGRFTGYRGIGKDVTERRSVEERIQHMAQHDNLTNLPNRLLFNDRLQQAINLAKRERHEFALLYFDLDKFKPVNDKYGHSIGDEMLKQVADRIQILLRESDTVARLGGDEFAALLPRVMCRQDAQEVSQKIISVLNEPFILDDIKEPVSIGVSIGIAIYPQDADGVDSLIKASDVAMYESKKTGNSFMFYSDMAKNNVPGPS